MDSDPVSFRVMLTTRGTPLAETASGPYVLRLEVPYEDGDAVRDVLQRLRANPGVAAVRLVAVDGVEAVGDE